MPSELYFKMVYQNASQQCARVWSAIEKIDDAARTVKTQLDNLQAEWKGEAGSTAYDVLFAWYIDLVRLSADLVSLKGRMDQQALAVITEWPQRLAELEDNRNGGYHTRRRQLLAQKAAERRGAAGGRTEFDAEGI